MHFKDSLKTDNIPVVQLYIYIMKVQKTQRTEKLYNFKFKL